MNVKITARQWNELVASMPEPHFLQTWEWAQVKARLGWQAHFLLWHDNENGLVRQSASIVSENETAITHHSISALCLLLERRVSIRALSIPLSVMYAPKGPLLLNWEDTDLRGRVLQDMFEFAHRQGAIFLKLDPDIQLGSGVPGDPGSFDNKSAHVIQAELAACGGHYSRDQVQFRNTVIIDLGASDDELLARMKQKTRYNIRLAERKGVTVRSGSLKDLELMYRMYAETSIRDGFIIRERDYYLTTWSRFMQPKSENDPAADGLIAEVGGEAVAALIMFHYAGRAWYVYGMSRELHREKMPNYLLQWHAICLARDTGCISYDLWGAPEVFDETDPLWGVYRFKEGLGGRVLRTLGAWDFPIRPKWYRLYINILPHLLNSLRSRGRVQTERTLGA